MVNIIKEYEGRKCVIFGSKTALEVDDESYDICEDKDRVRISVGILPGCPINVVERCDQYVEDHTVYCFNGLNCIDSISR